MKKVLSFKYLVIYYVSLAISAVSLALPIVDSREEIILNYYDNVSVAQAKYRGELTDLILKSDVCKIYHTKFDYMTQTMMKDKDVALNFKASDEYFGDPERLIEKDNLITDIEIKEKTKLSKLTKLLSEHLKTKALKTMDGSLPFYVIKFHKKGRYICSLVVSLPNSELVIRYPDKSVSYISMSDELGKFLVTELPVEKELTRFNQKYPEWGTPFFKSLLSGKAKPE